MLINYICIPQGRTSIYTVNSFYILICLYIYTNLYTLYLYILISLFVPILYFKDDRKLLRYAIMREAALGRSSSKARGGCEFAELLGL